MPRKEYPAPLVIPSLSEQHTHTIIALHGRGSNAEKFGRELIASANLQSRLPTVKFVFPTASKRRSTILKKIPINQWFDNYSLDDPGERTDLQINGLCETAAFLRGLIAKEADLLGDGGYGKVVLWCLSQGCAAGMFALLGGWPDVTQSQSIGAFHLKEILQYRDNPTSSSDDHELGSEEENRALTSYGDSDEDNNDLISDGESNEGNFSEPENDPFQQFTKPDDEIDVFFTGDEPEVPPPIQAVDYVREILDLPLLSTIEHESVAASLCQLQIRVFLGHGAQDPKVSVQLGEKMSRVLSTGLGMDVTWKPYEGLGHWYRVEDEIEDILNFLANSVRIPLAVKDESLVPLP
ncbi:hypothetical protein N7456_004317 [Penicillium angulare]|uniref:Acyl-protein thioesterase 1 n=1 Tax=Penicillium angulare TaxID=116970 RepID=A0A9W9KJJ2_9EURO|nr:hypothetical protein N7456_004317 [Penicillium angulare]